MRQPEVIAGESRCLQEAARIYSRSQNFADGLHRFRHPSGLPSYVQIGRAALIIGRGRTVRCTDAAVRPRCSSRSRGPLDAGDAEDHRDAGRRVPPCDADRDPLGCCHRRRRGLSAPPRVHRARRCREHLFADRVGGVQARRYRPLEDHVNGAGDAVRGPPDCSFLLRGRANAIVLFGIEEASSKRLTGPAGALS
jgi:hypothetical protein